MDTLLLVVDGGDSTRCRELSAALHGFGPEREGVETHQGRWCEGGCCEACPHATDSDLRPQGALKDIVSREWKRCTGHTLLGSYHVSRKRALGPRCGQVCRQIREGVRRVPGGGRR